MHWSKLSSKRNVSLRLRIPVTKEIWSGFSWHVKPLVLSCVLVQEVAKPHDPRCQKSLDLLKVTECSNNSKYRVWTSTGDCAKAIWNMKLLSHEKKCCSTLHTLHCITLQNVTYRRIYFRICFGSFSSPALPLWCIWNVVRKNAKIDTSRWYVMQTIDTISRGE